MSAKPAVATDLLAHHRRARDEIDRDYSGNWLVLVEPSEFSAEEFA